MYSTPGRFFTVMIVALSAPAPLHAKAPHAAALIGTWSCSIKGSDDQLLWTVTDLAPRGWLIGRGYLNGDYAAIETWSYDQSGMPQTRRQFAQDGLYVEMNSSTGPSEAKLVSTGYSLRQSGVRTPLRHTLSIRADGRLAILWEADFGEGYTVFADETCTRQETR